MHPLFVELFIATDADDPSLGEDWRRRARRSRRARSALVVKPAAARSRKHRPRP
jgi:hypothetical protein